MHNVGLGAVSEFFFSLLAESGMEPWIRILDSFFLVSALLWTLYDAQPLLRELTDGK